MPKRVRPTFEERQELRRRKAIVDEVSAILYRFDPMALASVGAPPDEYDGEARTIFQRLPSCETGDGVRSMVYEEFCFWFNDSGCGVEREYTGVAAAIWNWWQAYQAR